MRDHGVAAAWVRLIEPSHGGGLDAGREDAAIAARILDADAVFVDRFADGHVLFIVFDDVPDGAGR